MEQEYIKLISDLDGVIGQVRPLWLNATRPEEKVKWMAKINELLDNRLKLMSAKDAAKKLALT
jgi:hypothetical protein